MLWSSVGQRLENEGVVIALTWFIKNIENKPFGGLVASRSLYWNLYSFTTFY
jgi:hypothetical protein